jgi:predicted CoA-binding protein
LDHTLIVTASPLAAVDPPELESVLAVELAAVLLPAVESVDVVDVLLSPQAAMESTIAAARHKLKTFFFFIILISFRAKLFTLTISS